MGRLIDVEQAVEAVRLYFKHCANRQCPTTASDAVEFLLRTLPPAEPTAEEVEHVAMALTHERVGQVGGDPRETWLRASFTERDTAETLARTAIAAMRGGK